MNDRIREQARLESKQASACLAARLTGMWAYFIGDEGDEMSTQNPT